MTTPTIRIEGTCTGAELDKRTYLPGITIKSECPKCGAAYEDDMAHSYLSYPVVGEPKAITAYCGNEECQHEWSLGRVVIRMTLEIAPPDVRPRCAPGDLCMCVPSCA